MATEKYRYTIEEFNHRHGVNFDFDSFFEVNRRVNALGNFSAFGKKEKNVAQKTYVEALSEALDIYMKEKTKIGEGQYFDTFKRSNIPFTDVVKIPKKKSEENENDAPEENPVEENPVEEKPTEEKPAEQSPEVEKEDLPEIELGAFVMSFEKVMQERHLSDVAEGKAQPRDRKPFEGMSYERITKAVFAKVNKSYNKSMADVWTKRITDEKGFFENMQKETAEAIKPIDTLIPRPMDAISKNPFVDCAREIRMLVTAKKAMEKVVKSRGFFWKLWIGNWNRNAEEKEYLQSLTDKLDEYKNKGLSDALLDVIIGDDSRSVLHGTENEIETSVQEYKESLKNANAPEIRDASPEKITSAEKAKELFADQERMENLRDEIYNSIDFSKTATKFKGNIGAKKIWFVQFRAFTTPVINSMWDGFEKASSEAARGEALAEGAKKLFSTVEKHISLFSFSAADKYVEAQRITDFLMKKCSPAGMDEKYAQYTDKYFLRNVNAEDMPIDKDAYESKEKIIAYRTSLLAEARELAGIKKEPIQLPELSENANDGLEKSSKISQHDVPTVNKEKCP